MKKLFTTFLGICGMYIVAAQAPEIEWQKTLNGNMTSVQQISDNGYIVAGTYESNCWMAKTDETGFIQWERSFTNAGGYATAYSAQQTDDGGYVFVVHYSGSGVEEVIVYKLDPGGNLSWQKEIRESEIYKVYPSIQQTSDGGYILSLKEIDIYWYTNNHSWAIKLDSQGNTQWQKALGTSNNIVSIINTLDNGFIAIGNTITTTNTNNVWIVKLDNTGNVQWEKFYGGSGNEESNSVLQTHDGGYIIVGSTNSNDGDVTYNHGANDVWILKISVNGELEWQRTYGGTSDDKGNAIVEKTGEGNYLIAATSKSNDGDVSYNHGLSDVWIFKINSTGDILWEKSYGNSDNNTVNSIDITNDGGSVFVGKTTNGGQTVDNFIVKLEPHTYIPDSAFEQRLIDLGLDDILDGYVLTSNISDVTQLDVSNRNISDLTGIEDFASLVTLNCSNNQLTELVFGNGTGGRNTNATNDFGLEYLNASGNQLTELNVSGLTSLTTLLVNNNALTSLNVQNGNNTNFDAFNATNNPALNCIQVDDADWSTVNWTNIDPQTNFNEDCANMSITDQQLSQLEIYPNPVKDVVYFSKAIDGELFDISGKKVLTIKNAESVNVSALTKGVYILKTSEGITKKIVVK